MGQKWAAVGSLHLWIKQHRYLRAVPIEQGEATIALLLLWEADHGHPYPSQAVELVGRLSTFCKRLKEAVAADEELALAGEQEGFHGAYAWFAFFWSYSVVRSY